MTFQERQMKQIRIALRVARRYRMSFAEALQRIAVAFAARYPN